MLRFLPPVAALATGPVRLDGDPRLRDRPNAGLIAGAARPRRRGGRRRPRPGAVHRARHRPGARRRGRRSTPASPRRSSPGCCWPPPASTRASTSRVAGGAALDAARRHDRHDPAASTASRSPRPSAAGGCPPARSPRATVVVEPDLSNAAPFLAAALVTGGRVTVRDWPEVTTQPGAQLDRLLDRAWAPTVERTAEGLQVTGTGTISPLDADLGEVGELTPVLAALCALADGPSRLTGIAHLRGHETDRLQALDEVLTAVGARVRAAARRAGDRARSAPARAGGLLRRPPHGHAAAVLGLAIEGVRGRATPAR